MATYTYTGKLTDVGEAPFPGAIPRLWVEPATEMFGPGGPLATKRVPVTVAANGSFSVALVASVDTVPAARYRLRCEWLDGDTVLGSSSWDFNAVVGGGNITESAGAPASVWWVGPPWPAGLPSGFYFDKITNDVGRKL